MLTYEPFQDEDKEWYSDRKMPEPLPLPDNPPPCEDGFEPSMVLRRTGKECKAPPYPSHVPVTYQRWRWHPVMMLA